MNVTDETSPPPPPPPQADPPPSARRLVRTPDDKVFTGVCGGLGRYFAVDPVIFRIGFVVLSLAGGTGILLYLAGWLLVPDAETGTTEADRLLKGRNPNVALLALAVIACLLLADPFDDGPGDVFVALTLIGVGAAVLWSRRQRSGGAFPSPSPQPVDAPPTPPTVVADAPFPPAIAPDAPAATAAVPPPARPVKPPKPRSVLVPVTLSLTAIAAGVLALAGASLATVLAVTLVAIGAGLVVGAWRGRARALIPIGLLLTPVAVVATMVDVPFRGGIGERTYRPSSLAGVDSPYRLAVGELVVDLRAVDLAGQNVPVVASTAVGELRVIVPASVEVEVRGQAGGGEVTVFGRTWTGSDVDQRVVSPGTGGPGVGGRLVVRASVGLGEVEVRRAAA